MYKGFVLLNVFVFIPLSDTHPIVERSQTGACSSGRFGIVLPEYLRSTVHNVLSHVNCVKPSNAP